MGDKKMRKGQSLDEVLISDYMKQGEVLHLALSDKHGMFSIPVNYGYHNGKIYIHSSKHGRKIKALRNGGVIGFSVVVSHEIIEDAEPCEWGCAFKSVIGAGVPRILDDQEKNDALINLMSSYGAEEWNFSERSLKAVDVVEIMVTSISARTVGKE